MAKKFEPLITADEVQEILAEPKETVKPIAWIPKPALTDLQWMEFASPCRIKGEVREDVIFRATYRGARTAVHGQATIFLAEAFCASLFVGPHRVFGVDTDDSFHTSLVAKAGRNSARRWRTAAMNISGWTRARAMPSPSCPPCTPSAR